MNLTPPQKKFLSDLIDRGLLSPKELGIFNEYSYKYEKNSFPVPPAISRDLEDILKKYGYTQDTDE